MNISSLYEQKQYHKIIICRSYCKSDEDFWYLCISLFAIGRKNAAVALLNAWAEGVSDVEVKVMYLKSLMLITRKEEYSIEIDYWTKLPEWNKNKAEKNLLIPESLAVSLYEQVQSFKSAGACIQIGSFAESCLQDKKKSMEIQHSTDYGAIMFEAVARGGLIEEILKAIQTRPVGKWAGKVRNSLDGIELPFKGDTFAHVEFIRKLLYLASYYYLVRNDAETITFCKQAVSSILSFQLENTELELDGILSYEAETVAFMALEYVDTSISDGDLEMFLRVILSRGNIAEDFSQERLKRDWVFQNEHLKSPLRESKIFLSCGHVHRAQATKRASPVLIMLDDSKVSGIVMNRRLILEAARNYIISAAMDASDNPEIVRKYDQAIWCLLLGGGIDIIVMKLFFDLRCFHEKTLFFAFGEPSARKAEDGLNMTWPNYQNQFEVANMVSELSSCNRNSGIERLTPSVIECNDKLFVANSFLPIPLEYVHKEGILIESKQATSIRFTQSDVFDCVKQSRKLAQLWYDCYLESHKEMPPEFERFYHDRVMNSAQLKMSRPGSAYGPSEYELIRIDS